MTTSENGTDPSPGPEAGRGRSDEGIPEDGTLAGYFRAHQRPPSFQGSDGHPYTVSVEVEQVGDLRAPFGAYLVFPRWAIGGREVVGHVQSPILRTGSTREEVEARVGALALVEVKQILEEAIEETREIEW